MTRTLTQIYKRQAAYVRNSGFTVTVDEKYCYVVIENKETEQCYFLQGDEGYAYIDEYRDIWEKAGDLLMCDAIYGHAQQYIDCLD